MPCPQRLIFQMVINVMQIDIICSHNNNCISPTVTLSVSNAGPRRKLENTCLDKTCEIPAEPTLTILLPNLISVLLGDVCEYSQLSRHYLAPSVSGVWFVLWMWLIAWLADIRESTFETAQWYEDKRPSSSDLIWGYINTPFCCAHPNNYKRRQHIVQIRVALLRFLSS